MIALDTNLLIYAHRQATAEHKAAQKAIENALSKGPCGITTPTISEFWSIVTHPAAAGRASTPAEAKIFIANLSLGGIKIWQPGPDFPERFMQLASDLHISGVRIFDLQIALIAFENGASEIWTHDKNFVSIPGLRKHDPITHI